MGLIKDLEIRPFVESISPALLINLKLAYEKRLGSIISISGSLMSEDGKVLSKLVDAKEFGKGYETLGEIMARRSYYDKLLGKKEEPSIPMVAFLNREVLDYIDEVRDRNPKKDVIFKLKVRFRFLAPHASIAHLHEKTPQEYGLEAEKGETLITYKYSSEFVSDRTNLWVISGESGPVFLRVEDRVEEFSRRIPAQDWIHDFAPFLGIGKYLVVELPIPEPIKISGELANRIEEASKSLDKMKEDLLACEWNRVIEDSRPVFELFRKYGRKLVKEILTREGYTEEAIKNLINSIDSLFHYSSKFHHRTDESGKKIMPEIKASKEDAYLIYTTAMGLVNLLARKVKRLQE